jgi:type III restriction enzyme
MSTKILKRYQEKAVNKLLLRTDELLNENIPNRTIVFQSPTGSGKTFMMSEYIGQLIKRKEEFDFCFLWISIGKGALQIQSYNSLKKEFQGFPDIYLLEQEFFGSRDTMQKNEVVIVNWEKLRSKDNKTGEWKNLLMKDKETTNFRELIKNTKEENTKIIMIIDESHSNSTSERALELRDEIVNADLTIEMSATPVLREGEYNERVTVQPNDVIIEGMIKKEIIINENIDDIDDNEITSQELIMQAAFSKREVVKSQYKAIGININPLVMIQLPQSVAGEDKQSFIENFLSDKEVTYENKKLAIWLSEEKLNNENEIVTPNDSTVEFLIFKQAIDTGWDCPRAQILVRFREIRSIVFEIQTIGRILRMPEAKHYENDSLNKGYVYTNVKSLEVKKETYNPNIIKSIVVKRKENYKPIKLMSYYRNRIDFGDVTSSFYKVIDEVFCSYFNIPKNIELDFYKINKQKISEKINLENIDNQDDIILNKNIDMKTFDNLPKHRIEGEEADLFSPATLMKANLSQDDLYHAFEYLIKINLHGFAFKRSVSIFKQSLYRWFRKYLNIQPTGNGIIYIQNIILNNPTVFSKLFDEAILRYKPIKNEEILKKIEDLEEWNDEWEISERRNLNPYTYKLNDCELSLYQPCYLKIDSSVERDFIEYLERKKDIIEWWWQNGNEHMSSNFGIKYNYKSTFQPDFLVKFKDDRLGIFDTKSSGFIEDENKLKNEALQQLIINENEKDKHIFGGLVIKEGQHFRINSKQAYYSFKAKPEDWEFLNF